MMLKYGRGSDYNFKNCLIFSEHLYSLFSDAYQQTHKHHFPLHLPIVPLLLDSHKKPITTIKMCNCDCINRNSQHLEVELVFTDIRSTWFVFHQACQAWFELFAMPRMTPNCSSGSTNGMVLIMVPTMAAIRPPKFYQPCRWGGGMESVYVRLQSELCES